MGIRRWSGSCRTGRNTAAVYIAAPADASTNCENLHCVAGLGDKPALVCASGPPAIGQTSGFISSTRNRPQFAMKEAALWCPRTAGQGRVAAGSATLNLNRTWHD
jgi:hypothetical protein